MITDKIAALQAMLADGALETALRLIHGGTGQMNFSISLSSTNTSYSFSASDAAGQSETYTKMVPYTAPTESSPA